jgi:hypothetical protein
MKLLRPYHIRLTETMVKELDRIADLEGQTTTALVRYILREFLFTHRKDRK